SLLNKLNFLKECNIKHLIDSLSEDEYKKAELIYCVWYLIANRYIKCDLNKDLNLNTVIWAT
ncbi:heteromeric transposase endonuclease subunit TnsA, partial [Flavobacterium circumlabens]